MKRTAFQTRVVNALQNSSAVNSDHVICKADGSVIAKRSFFYHHGQTAELFAGRIREAVMQAGIAACVRGSESWNSWPNTSWFVATIKEQV